MKKVKTSIGPIEVRMPGKEEKSFMGREKRFEASTVKSEFLIQPEGRYNAVMAIESIVRAHACCGIDITSQKYEDGINLAMQYVYENIP